MVAGISMYGNECPRRRRVVIIGAGMAGLSAAHHLLLLPVDSALDVTVLEASDRIGGRIWSAEFSGDRVEMGATWVQGTEGSPVYAIAVAMAADHAAPPPPFERQDGFPEEPPIFKAQGGLTVDYSAIVEPVTKVYDELLSEIRSSTSMPDREACCCSIGTVMRNAFRGDDHDADTIMSCSSASRDDLPWNLRRLQDAVVRSKEDMERVETAADSLFDLAIAGEIEYKDFPGEHLTIAAGYSTVIRSLASSLNLPHAALHLNKQVCTISWNLHSSSSSEAVAMLAPPSLYPVLVTCTDGSIYEADHVIVTVSLGILKASVLQQSRHGDHELSFIPTSPWESPEGQKVCRSIADLHQLNRLSSELVAATPPVFDPPLPPWKVDAISKLGYGVVDKLFLHLNPKSTHRISSELATSHVHLLYHSDEPELEAGIPWWMRRTFSIAPIYKGSSVLLLWFAGAEALEMEGLSDEEIMWGVERTLASFGLVEKQLKVDMVEEGSCKSSEDMEVEEEEEEEDGSRSSSSTGGGSPTLWSSSSSARETSDQSCSASASDGEGGGSYNDGCRNYDKTCIFSAIRRSRWGRHPLFLGSYSYVATGSSGVDAEALAAPLPSSPDLPPLQLLFAGEATDREFYSTTHGAFLSGLREATRLLHHLSQERYEAPLVFWWGTRPTVVITHPDDAKCAMSADVKRFDRSQVFLFFRSLLGNGLILLNGDQWHRHRNIVRPAFFADRLKDMVAHMTKSAMKMIGEWEKQVAMAGGWVNMDIVKPIKDTAADILSRTLFGFNYRQGRAVFEMQVELLELLVRLSIPYYAIPGFRYLPTGDNRRVVTLEKKVNLALRYLVESRRIREEGGNGSGADVEESTADMLGLMVTAAKSEESGGGRAKRSNSESFATQMIVDECKTFFFAGHESTAVLLSWTMLLLSLHPEWQERARNEVLEMCDGQLRGERRQLQPDVLSRLKIVGMVLNETLRLYPPAPLLGRRDMNSRDEAFKLGSRTLPRDTAVLVDVLYTHRRKDIWGDDADEFKPQRFSDGVVNACKHPYGFVPFGIGPRICIGQHFAMVEAKVILSLILAHFKFRLSPTYVHAPVDVVTVRPKHGLQLILEPLQ